MTIHPSLTAADVAHLTTVLEAAQDNRKVTWVTDHDSDPRQGVTRRVAPFNGDTHVESTDVRDHFLHISGVVETWLPVTEVITMIREGRIRFHSK